MEQQIVNLQSENKKLRDESEDSSKQLMSAKLNHKNLEDKFILQETGYD